MNKFCLVADAGLVIEVAYVATSVMIPNVSFKLSRKHIKKQL